MPRSRASLQQRIASMATPAELGQVHFTSYDGYALMEADWARDVARWAKGDTSDDLTAVIARAFYRHRVERAVLFSRTHPPRQRRPGWCRR